MVSASLLPEAEAFLVSPLLLPQHQFTAGEEPDFAQLPVPAIVLVLRPIQHWGTDSPALCETPGCQSVPSGEDDTKVKSNTRYPFGNLHSHHHWYPGFIIKQGSYMASFSSRAKPLTLSGARLHRKLRWPMAFPKPLPAVLLQYRGPALQA